MRNLISNAVSTVLMAAAASAEAPKGSGAVQHTTTGPYQVLPEHSPEGAVLKDMNKADLKAAYKSIDAAYNIQWGEGGIEDTQEKLKGLQGKVGEHVFDVAKAAYERCKGKLNVARLYFLALCEKAEQHCQSLYVEKYREEKPIGQLIPLWSQYKSSLAKGMELGIDPMDRDEEGGSLKYPTAALYRAEVQKATTAERSTGSQAGQTRNDSKETVTNLQPVIKGWSAAMAAAMQVLMPQLNRLTHEEQDKFVDAVLALANDVKAFADKRESDAANSQSDFNKGTETVDQDLDAGTKAALQAAIDKDKDPKPQEKIPAAAASGGRRRGARPA